MKAVLLSAGKGQRLEPLTSTRPKHLIKVAGKPILQFCLDAVKAAGITDIIIVVHYMGDKIRDYFGDGTSQGLKISYVEQKELLGTGNAVMAAEQYVDEKFVLIYGDLLFAQDAVKRAVNLYEEAKPEAVITAVRVEVPENYGVIDVMEGKKLGCIIEKPQAGKASSNLVSAGIHVFSRVIFEKMMCIKKSVRGEVELTDALAMFASEGKTVLVVELDRNAWFDVGRPCNLLDANRWALKHLEPQTLGTIEQGVHLIGSVHVAKTARIRSGVYIEGPVFVDEGADVGPNCFIHSGTSIGKKVRVGNAVEIENSLIMDNTHIGHLSYIRDSIIGENCDIGAGAITTNIRFDYGKIKMIVRNKKVDTGKHKLGAILGDNVKTGINASFMSNVKVGTNTWIGPNYMVVHDIPKNSSYTSKKTRKYTKKEI